MQFDIRQSLPRVRYSFSCDASPDRVWDVRRVELVEELSRPYTLTLDLLTDGLDLDPESLLVGNGELILDRELEVRTVCGVITRVEITDPIADAVPVRLVLQPALALLEHRNNTRLWPYETARRAVEAVLDAALIDYGREVDLSHLLDNWRVRPGVAQYQESDLAVVSRLLEDDGIAYHFDHERGSGREVLVLENSADHWELVPTPEGDGVVPVIEDRHDQAEVESLQRLTWSRALRPSAVVRQVNSWQFPTDPEQVIHLVDAPGPVREVYLPVHLPEDDDTRVVRELAQLRTGARVLTGVGNVIGFAPGRRFKVDPSHRPELADYEFLITKVTTRGDCPDVELGAGAGEDRFSNEFECVILDEYSWLPPRRTPIPRVYGPVTGIVVGAEGQEIQVDEYGRVKVRIDWDREHGLHDDSSMWIRVAQSWAGAGFGAWFVPRVGMEVVIEFLAGDPACPIITGCVYNEDARTSIDPEQSPTQSTIRTRSSPGGKGYNELRFEDAAGGEEIFIHAQRNLREVVGSNHATTIGGDSTLTVKGDHTVRVEGQLNQTVVGEHIYDYENARTVTSYEADTHHVLGPALRDYQQGLERTIQGPQTTTVTTGQGFVASSTLDVSGEIVQTSSTGQTLRGQHLLTLNQGGSADNPAAKITLADAVVGAKGREIHAEAETFASLVAGQRLTLEADHGVLVKQGAADITLENETIKITATEIVLEAGESKITIGALGITIEAAAGITIDSKAEVNVKGSMVKLN